MSFSRRFDNIVSGQRRDVTAAVARSTLRILEEPYTQVIGIRNRYYDRQREAVKRVKVPVISVGNLTMGGTGKTPMVAWLASYLQRQGVNPVIVSRGYRRKSTSTDQGPDSNRPLNDEGRELQWRLPNVHHVQNPDRVAGARQAIDQHGADVIVLDDGFQHRRLHRDLNIVLLDARQPFGYDHVFPRGTLREPIAALRRADAVIVTRSDQVDAATLTEIESRARPLCHRAAWCQATHKATSFSNRKTEQPIEFLRGQKVAAFCAIGQPAAFRRTLEDCGLELVGFCEFADHHAFTARDQTKLAAWGKQRGADVLVCTQKDFVKLTQLNQKTADSLPVWSLQIAMQIENSRGLSQLLRSIHTLLPSL